MTGLSGSDEASPPTLIDMAARDRRWMQGNLQHMAVLPAKGLAPISRIHLSIGIFSYLSSVVWLSMLLVGLSLVTQEKGREISYFSEESLYPQWPTFDPDAGLHVLFGTIAIVFLPKLLGLFVALLRVIQKSATPVVRSLQLTLGFLLELVVSALMAPIFMLLHLQFLAEIFLGRDSGWNAQNRRHRNIRIGEAIKFHWMHVACGGLLTAVAISIDESVALWLSPLIAGLLLSPFLTWYTSRRNSNVEAWTLCPLRPREGDPFGVRRAPA